MNTMLYQKPVSEIFNTWQSVAESTNAALHILSRLGDDILKNQSEASANWITETACSATAPLSPSDVAHSLWQVPSRYQAQSNRLVDALLATASVVSRGQQELTEWAGQVYSDSIQQTTQAMSNTSMSDPQADANGTGEAGRRLQRPGVGRRTRPAPSVSLVELSPPFFVEGREVSGGIIAPDDVPLGLCREMCPHCQDAPLMLVLRSQHVMRTHLFCENCTRCYDAVYPDGVSAFTPAAVPIE